MPFLSASGVSPYNKIRVGSGGGVELPFAFDNALEFDGVNDYVDLGSGAAVLSTAFEWTISLWIKPSKTGVSLGGDNSSANDLLYLINSTLFRVQFAGGSAALSRLNFTIPSVTLNQWHHVCITKDSSNDVRVYWNGTESVTGALPTNDTLNMYQLGSYRRTGLWFDGVMDEFGLDVTTAASLPQVSDLYNNGNGASFLKVMPSARVNYHLNEVSGSSVAVDATTNGNDGTLNNFNTSTCWVAHGFGFGNALDFDGVNDYVSLPTWGTTTSNLTISVWLNLTSASGLQAVISSTASDFCHFQLNSGAVGGYIYGPNVLFSSTTNFGGSNLGTWFHVVLTYELGITKLYVNGVLETTSFSSATPITAPTTFNMGVGIGGGRFLHGVLDEVGVDRTKTATQVQVTALYNSGNGDDFTTVMGSSNNYYKLNESGTDTIAVDSSGNGNDGTLTNFPASGMWVAH